MRHRFPAEIISHRNWLYLRFCLSYRDVEALMAERGISLTYEAVRYGCWKFGKHTQMCCAGGAPDPVTSGTWTKSVSLSTANGTICGG